LTPALVRRALQWDTSLKNIRPGQTDPLAGGDQPQRLATILVRFLILLTIVIAILTVAWA
jgi:hypothetical protein